MKIKQHNNNVFKGRGCLRNDEGGRPYKVATHHHLEMNILLHQSLQDFHLLFPAIAFTIMNFHPNSFECKSVAVQNSGHT